jgi:predicted nucleic acid-binding protein
VCELFSIATLFVSACLASQGAPATIVELALLKMFTLCLSFEVFSEYREVLARPKFSRHLERIESLFGGIEEISERVYPEHKLAISPR